MARELITKAEYARRRGVSKPAVTQAIARCGIPLIDGKIDPVLADAAWKARTDPEQSRRGAFNRRPDPPPMEIGPDGEEEPAAHDWRARRDRAEAKLAELELLEKVGTLVKEEDVQRRGRQLAAAIVQQSEAIPDRIAAEFGADETHRNKIRQRLRDELDRMRAEIARAGLAPEQ